jgi:hypothetical protein
MHGLDPSFVIPTFSQRGSMSVKRSRLLALRSVTCAPPAFPRMISPAFLDASMATCRIWSRSASSVPSWTVVVVEADIWIGATRGRMKQEEKEGECWKAGDVTKDFTSSPQSTRRRIDDRRITDGQENLIVTVGGKYSLDDFLMIFYFDISWLTYVRVCPLCD